MSRRNDMDICADILQVARGGARKTRIVYQANLNFKLVEKYLRRLIHNGLIQRSDRFFTTTSKGARFIEQYGEILTCARENSFSL